MSEPLQKQFNLKDVERHIFTEAGGEIFIGGEKVSNSVRSVLRDQAKSFMSSQLWEIFEATIVNESGRMALHQSQNWEHVLSAKQLHHWHHVLKNIMHSLSK
jgi:hypothetical protein